MSPSPPSNPRLHLLAPKIFIMNDDVQFYEVMRKVSYAMCCGEKKTEIWGMKFIQTHNYLYVRLSHLSLLKSAL